MNAANLLHSATEKWTAEPSFARSSGLEKTLENGAVWMHGQMLRLRPEVELELHPVSRFTLFGVLKYGLAAVTFLISCLVFYAVHWLLVPFSILVFFIVEVHFLFLFPILLEKKANPIRKSICLTHHIGLLKCTAAVIQIAFFMVCGLLNFQNPLKNWHIGCLAVLLFYDENRNRLPCCD